jgi:predicted RNA-binding protein associated with RNAse of E/G family
MIYLLVPSSIDSFYVSIILICCSLFRAGDAKQIANALLKLNTDGYLKSDFVMFIDKNYNYVVSIKEDLIKPGGYIDAGKVKTMGNFTINDLYPKIGIK